MDTMNAQDDVVLAVLKSLGEVQEAMADKVRALRTTSSNVERDLEFRFKHESDLESPIHFEIKGYVDAQLSSRPSYACWTFSASWIDDRWEVLRTVEHGESGDMESVANLPSLMLDSSVTLAKELPDLVTELMTLSPPQLESDT
jgi:hypothetical protein